MLSGFPYGRNQHVRRMRSSIVSVVYYVFIGIFYILIKNVLTGSTTCPVLVQYLLLKRRSVVSMNIDVF